MSTRLLHVVCTPRGLASNTGGVSGALLEGLLEQDEDIVVTTLDLFTSDLPAIGEVREYAASGEWKCGPDAASPVRDLAGVKPARDGGRLARASGQALPSRAASSRSRISRVTPSTGIRSWAIESRSRTVTAPSSSESTSTVTHHGVPISSWRR